MNTHDLTNRLQEIYDTIDPEGNKHNWEALKKISRLIKELELDERLQTAFKNDKSHTSRLAT